MLHGPTILALDFIIEKITSNVTFSKKFKCHNHFILESHDLLISQFNHKIFRMINT
jgi:hypothetical protein